jgi:hypothetical protein
MRRELGARATKFRMMKCVTPEYDDAHSSQMRVGTVGALGRREASIHKCKRPARSRPFTRSESRRQYFATTGPFQPKR